MFAIAIFSVCCLSAIAYLAVSFAADRSAMARRMRQLDAEYEAEQRGRRAFAREWQNRK